MLWTHFVIYASVYVGLFTSIFFFLTYIKNIRGLEDPELKEFPFVSVIVPVYNEEKTIIKTVTSLLKLDYPKDKYEIIVVNDGSTDNTASIVKSLISKNRLTNIKIFSKENGGKGSAMNYGIKRSRAEIIVSMDADSMISPWALKKMLGYFQEDKVAAVTPAMSIFNVKGFWLRIQLAEFMLGIYMRKVFDLNEAIHIVPGPFSAYKRSFFEKHGYFDEHNVTEDTEIAMRIQAKGYKIKNSMSANVYVIQPKTFMSVLRQRIRWYYGFTKNAMKYKKLFPPYRWDTLALLILPSAFVAVIIAFALLYVFLYQGFSTVKDTIVRLFVTNFDITPWFYGFKWRDITEFLYSYITNPFIFFMILGIVLSLLILYIGKKKSNEKSSILLAYIPFLLTYWFVYPFWWLSVLVYKGILRRKIKWGKRYY